VPHLEKFGATWVEKEYPINPDGIIVKRNRPQIEGSLVRTATIEHKDPNIGMFWKVTKEIIR
tara:strand:- start:103334 stop:103519 length:186 start_codon:yes stop_codon:yes gene_type:complete